MFSLDDICVFGLFLPPQRSFSMRQQFIYGLRTNQHDTDKKRAADITMSKASSCSWARSGSTAVRVVFPLRQDFALLYPFLRTAIELFGKDHRDGLPLVLCPRAEPSLPPPASSPLQASSLHMASRLVSASAEQSTLWSPWWWWFRRGR